jgi:hypothetical protein
MNISPFATSPAALSPRLGAILALTAIFALSAGAGEAQAGLCDLGGICGGLGDGGGGSVNIGGGGGGGGGGLSNNVVTQDFYLSFSGGLTGGGSISGSATLVAQERPVVVPASAGAPSYSLWSVTQVLDGTLAYQPSSGIGAGDYSLAFTPPHGGIFATVPSPYSNDNLLYYPGNPDFLDSLGIGFNVLQSIPFNVLGRTEYENINVGYLVISDGNYNLSTNILGSNGTATGVNVNLAPGSTPGTGPLGLAFLMLAGAAARARGLLAR